jgi:hypothetical protein
LAEVVCIKEPARKSSTVKAAVRIIKYLRINPTTTNTRWIKSENLYLIASYTLDMPRVGWKDFERTLVALLRQQGVEVDWKDRDFPLTARRAEVKVLGRPYNKVSAGLKLGVWGVDSIARGYREAEAKIIYTFHVEGAKLGVETFIEGAKVKPAEGGVDIEFEDRAKIHFGGLFRTKMEMYFDLPADILKAAEQVAERLKTPPKV